MSLGPFYLFTVNAEILLVWKAKVEMLYTFKSFLLTVVKSLSLLFPATPCGINDCQLPCAVKTFSHKSHVTAILEFATSSVFAKDAVSSTLIWFNNCSGFVMFHTHSCKECSCKNGGLFFFFKKADTNSLHQLAQVELESGQKLQRDLNLWIVRKMLCTFWHLRFQLCIIGSFSFFKISQGSQLQTTNDQEFYLPPINFYSQNPKIRNGNFAKA